jgi:hypothetical protein
VSKAASSNAFTAGSLSRGGLPLLNESLASRAKLSAAFCAAAILLSSIAAVAAETARSGSSRRGEGCAWK